MSTGHFSSPCRKRLTVRASDITANDFKVSVVATPNGGDFDIAVTIRPAQHFTDIATITQSGNAIVYDDAVDEANAITDTGVNTTGAPNALTITAVEMPQTESNVGNTWAATFANLVVVTKSAQTLTIPLLRVTFPSPL